MQPSRRAFAAGAALAFALPACVFGQEKFPTRPVKFIVPYPPGQSADLVPRLLANELARIWGQGVVVDNRAGGASIPGMQAGKEAAPVGIHIRGGPLEESPADFERVLRVNLTAMYYTIRAVLPHMLRAGRGSIVNNSSVAGIRAMLPNAAYAASKAGVLGLTQNVGVTYASKGIRCNAVVPGYIATPRVTQRLSMESGSDRELFEAKLKERAHQVPSGKHGDAWDIAYAVLFLASDESKYVNATSIVVDGGLSASTTGEPW